MIQAFEFTHELSWLLLKDFLIDQGISCVIGSRDVVREAVVRELLPAGTENTWMAMIRSHPHVQKVVLYAARALGRQRAGSDIDICLVAPFMTLGELLELGAALNDLLLPWNVDLQPRHLIAHEGLLSHLDRTE